MADSRRDPQHGDLLTHRNQMIAVTERQGDLVSYLLRYANGAEISGVLSLDDWFRSSWLPLQSRESGGISPQCPPSIDPSNTR